MKVFKGYRLVEHAPPRAVVTIGNFDGVHLGHRRIIETAIGRARARGGTLIAYTFRPHPQLVLKGEGDNPHQLLSTYDEKIDRLGELGIDWVIEEPFSLEFSTTSPELFFSEILHQRLAAEAIVVGYDFGFGKGRAAGIEALKKFCSGADVELTVVPPFEVSPNEGVVSSSRIRRTLLEGDLPAANRLLGREFSYRGRVERGEARGRKLGFPTANLKPEKLLLPLGVYATWTVIGGERHASVTNVGVRPTFAAAGAPVRVETHLIGKALELYGKSIEVRFVQRLRGEQKFSGLEELRAQIAKDIGDARTILGA